MSRLMQGDVGCGKTAVAALAAARALGSGRQVALMAPTELLAEQHCAHLRRAGSEPLGIDVIAADGLAARAHARARSILQRVARDEVAIVVGTHALFQDDVEFTVAGAGHRRRAAPLRRAAAPGRCTDKGGMDGRIPHQLIMTATPIPRTLAMTVYADLDVSVIDELPPGRTPVRTVVMPEERRAEVVQRIEATCLRGRQVYWVCGVIEESEELDHQAAEEAAATLTAALPQRARGPGARAHEAAGEGRGDARLRGRRSPAAGGDHGHRGGRRRAQRHA